VHEQAYDVDAMYDPSGRYRYNKYGTNWRAVVAWFVAWIPLTPGFASGVGLLSGAWRLSWILTLTTAKVTPSLKIATGARHLAGLGYLYGFFVSAGVYILLSRVFVARQTIVKIERGSV
jgi:NCS1 family nucleobase:cation symporter-1